MTDPASPARLATTMGATIALATACLAAPVAAAPRDDQTIEYYLPRTEVFVTLTRTLKACPTQLDREPLIKSEWAVASAAAPDPKMLVKVDVSNGFLAKRSNSLSFHPNGALSEFNSSSQGQGGPVLSAVLKAAGVIAPIIFGFPPVPPVMMAGGGAGRPKLYCSKAVVEALKRVDDLDKEVTRLNGLIEKGAATAADLRMLDIVKARRADARKPLVSEAQGVLLEGTEVIAKPDGSSVTKPTMTAKADALKSATWFVDSSPATGAIGFDPQSERLQHLKGYTVRLKPVVAEFLPDATKVGVSPSGKARRVLVYRRPVLANVITRRSDCTDEKCDEAIELDAPLAIAQWGRLQELAVGKAGLFGSREAKATFDAFGTPTLLSFGSDSGGEAIAGTIDAATATVGTLRDAETAALTRKIEKAELRQKLRDLQTAADE